MILAIIESKSGGTASPSATPVSMRTPGPVRILKRSISARGRSKAVVRIFRIQPHLNGVAGGARRFSFQAAAARDVNLKLHQIEPGGAFRHRMFDLQAGYSSP